jgi:hypothetical protein
MYDVAVSSRIPASSEKIMCDAEWNILLSFRTIFKCCFSWL